MKATILTRSMRRSVRRGFTLVELLVVIGIIALLAGVAYGPIIAQMKKADANQATQNAKNLGYALNTFKEDFGNYPDDNTANRVLKKHDYLNSVGRNFTGDYSNDYLRQMLYQPDLSESSFFAKIATKNGQTRNPDNDTSDGKGLEGGEVGFAYVMAKSGNNKKRGVANEPGEFPVLVSPLEYTDNDSPVVPGNMAKFDLKSFVDRAVIYTNAQNAKLVEIDGETGTVKNLIPKYRGKDVSDQYILVAPDFSGNE